MGRKRALSEEQIDTAVTLYGQGLSLRRIAYALDVGAKTVHRRLLERGVGMRGHGGTAEWPQSVRDEALKLRDEGLTLREISEQLGPAVMTIHRWEQES